MKYLYLTALLLMACSHSSPKTETHPATEAVPMKNKKIMRLEFRGETTLAVTQAGQKIQLGGFSGLRFLGKNSDGKLRFLTLTDRGPNASEEERNGHIYRPFALPEFQPRIVFLLADTQAGTFSVEKVIPLLRPDGKPLSGLPPHEGGEIPVSLKNEPLPYDPYGMDPEGIVQQADGTFWIGEEYGPSLAHFSAEGQLLEVLKPGQGLPKVFEQIKLNRGFEGLAMGNGKLYGMLQSPLDNPRSEGQKNSAASHLVRIVAVDPEGQKTLGQYAYLLGPGKADKIGDIAVAGPDEFYAIEQNGKEGAQSIKKVFRFRLGKATNLQLLPEKIVGPGGTLESIKRGKLAEAGVIPAEKEELCDLAELGVKEAKVEGIDLLGEKSIAVIVDNDFGLAGEWDRKNGTAVMKDEKPALYLINLD